MNIPQFSGSFSIRFKRVDSEDMTRAKNEIYRLYETVLKDSEKRFLIASDSASCGDFFQHELEKIPYSVQIDCSDEKDKEVQKGIESIHTLYPDAFEKVTLLSSTEEGTFIQAKKPVVNPSPPISGDC